MHRAFLMENDQQIDVRVGSMVIPCSRTEEPDLSEPFTEHTPIACDGLRYGFIYCFFGRGWIVHHSKRPRGYQFSFSPESHRRAAESTGGYPKPLHTTARSASTFAHADDRVASKPVGTRCSVARSTGAVGQRPAPQPFKGEPRPP